jgi:hypothetical protein
MITKKRPRQPGKRNAKSQMRKRKLSSRSNFIVNIILLEYNQELILVTTDRLHEKDLRDTIEVRDDLLQVDISLVENDIWVVGVDAVEHQLLVLDHIALRLLGDVMRLAIHKQDDLAPTQ